SGNHELFNSTGALKEGQVGIVDYKPAASAQTRYFDGFRAFVPTVDQAVFASRSLEIRRDQARRIDPTGVTWGKAPYEGDYCRVLPAGHEQAVSRVIAKLSRNPYQADTNIDDVNAQLYVTPRWLMAPPN
ncbi:MAG TPA: hypothetical protein VG458_07785, partial [Solirubrobacterales bacterium]|nr:hypothetical protein [Solirubrobacterales bacterium]